MNVTSHASLVGKLEQLLKISKKMKTINNDTLLNQYIEECESWLLFAKGHTDIEALKSLKREIASRFYQRYNVRIEPKDLDNQRLTINEDLIDDLDAAC